MVEFKLDEVNAATANDPLWHWRGRAIEAYGAIEQSLCSLMSALTGMDGYSAATIFFRISNAQSVNSIMDRLIHKKYGSTYNPFWNSYLTELRKISVRRNEIVHYHSVTELGVADDKVTPMIRLVLMPPNYWIDYNTTPKIVTDDLIEFVVKCDIYARACNGFILIALGKVPTQGPSHDIYLRPLIYPLPEGHLLSPKPRAPQTPPQS